MAIQLKSDKELLTTAEQFFIVATAAACKSDEEARLAFASGRFRFSKGMVFKQSDEIQIALRALVDRCLRLLGAKIITEDDIHQIAWELVVLSVSQDKPASVEAFIHALETSSVTPFTYIFPNYSVRFEDGVKEVSLGRVKVCLGETLATEINSRKENPHWEIVVSSNAENRAENQKLYFGVQPVCWQVSVNGTAGIVEQEALWLIDIALSLLRFSYYQSSNRPAYFPGPGDSEALPVSRQEPRNQRLALQADEKITVGGWATPLHYVVGKEISDYLISTKFAEQAKLIFDPSKDTIAERIAQGLGWMTRGRRSLDQSERFLFFFTAIEALLTHDDKTAPIVQTIARHAATILVSTPEERHSLAKDIRKFYEIRSALVHKGHRNVSHSDAKRIQMIVESLYWLVMEKLDFTQPVADFHANLAKASYGLPWPL